MVPHDFALLCSRLDRNNTCRKIQNKSQPTKPRLRTVWISVGILTIELDATSGRRSGSNLKLHFKFHNMNMRNFKVQ